MHSVLVTGAASGIGKGVACDLIAKGYRVTLFDQNAEAVVALASELGESAIAVVGSVAEYSDCVAAVEQAVTTFGCLGGVSHNAGIQRYGTAADTKKEVWDEVISVNLTGAFNVARAALPQICERGGSIVFMGSVQSLASQQNVAAYTASKHGLLGLTQSMAVDFAKERIRVNLVAPGAVETPLLEQVVSLADDPESLRKILREMHPLGRCGTVEDIAAVVSFLLSDGASFVTGAVIRVDGGLLSQIAGTPRRAENEGH